jgi:hypothetical protein
MNRPTLDGGGWIHPASNGAFDSAWSLIDKWNSRFTRAFCSSSVGIDRPPATTRRGHQIYLANPTPSSLEISAFSDFDVGNFESQAPRPRIEAALSGVCAALFNASNLKGH